MKPERTENKGGFHIGSVGGNMKISAGGDIVGGDKTTATTIQHGFAGEEQKKQFQVQIEQLRDALRAVKAQFEADRSLSADQKDDVVAEVLQHITALKNVQESTAALPAGKPAPADIASVVESTLARTDGVLTKLHGIAEKTVGVAEIVGQFAARFGPLIASARHLFGLP
jgi:hypothetical protein